jgi:hypothetical protein
MVRLVRTINIFIIGDAFMYVVSTCSDSNHIKFIKRNLLVSHHKYIHDLTLYKFKISDLLLVTVIKSNDKERLRVGTRLSFISQKNLLSQNLIVLEYILSQQII